MFQHLILFFLFLLGSLVTSSIMAFQNDSLNQTNCTEFKYLAYTVTYTIMVPIGFFSNLVALFVFLRHTTRKTASTVFMTNLAISDVCFSLTLPFRLVYYFRECNWNFGDWLCRWCVFSFYMNLYTSVLFLTGLSVLRYLAVVHPIRNKSLVTIRRASLTCFCIWMFVASMSSPFLMSGTTNINGKMSCFEIKKDPDWKRIEQLNYVGLIFGFVIPFIIILGCYGCIIQKLFANTNLQLKNRRQGQRRRSLYLIIVIFSTFLLCFAPYHIVRTLHLRAAVLKNEEQEKLLLKISVITLCMAAFNSCLNPLLYYFAGENFRTSFSKASQRWTISSLNDSMRLSRYSWRSQPGSQRKRCQSIDTVLRSETKMNDNILSTL